MIDLKNIIKRDCIDWNDDPYIYEKNSEDKYEYITFGKFIKHSLGIAKYLIDNGYKDKKIIMISENSSRLMEFDLAVTFYVGVSAVVSKEWKLNDLLLGIEELNADLVIYSDRYKDLITELQKQSNIPVLRMNDVEEAYDESLLDLEIKAENDLAKIVFSSGTTGKSKAVMLSLKNIFVYPFLYKF